MECKDFRLLINDYIDGKIENEKTLEKLVNHAQNCKDCKEELEMFYAVKMGIGDDDSGVNTKAFDYNFDKKVKDLLDDTKKEINKNRLIRKITRIILIVALAIIIGIAIYIGMNQNELIGGIR